MTELTINIPERWGPSWAPLASTEMGDSNPFEDHLPDHLTQEVTPSCPIVVKELPSNEKNQISHLQSFTQEIPPLSTRAIVKMTLLESIPSTAIVLITACFRTSVAEHAVPFMMLVSQISIQILWKVEVKELLLDPNLKNYPMIKLAKKMDPYIKAMLFTTFSYAFLEELIHECGHLIASSLLFTNSHPTIRLHLLGGITYYEDSPLSSVGSKIGFDNSIVLRAASGSIISVIVSLAYLITHHQIKHHHPEISRYLICMIVFTLIHHIWYALSTFYQTSDNPMYSRHDFINLSAHGIHPLISVIAILAVPLTYQIGYELYKLVR